jgi:hypothetical protein
LKLIESVGSLHETREPYLVVSSKFSCYRVGLEPTRLGSRSHDFVKPNAVCFGDPRDLNSTAESHPLDQNCVQARLHSKHGKRFVDHDRR